MMRFERAAATAQPPTPAAPTPSELTHWPVQINLLPTTTPLFDGARLLIAADCVPVAYADFHRRLLAGRVVMIGCPKFDDVEAYVARLAEIFQRHELQEVVVARMEVPCCRGLTQAVEQARARAGRALPIREVIIGTQGHLGSEREIPPVSNCAPTAHVI